MRSSRWLLWLAVGVKAATVGMLGFALTHTEWERFSDKAMGGRAVAYLPALTIIPVLCTGMGSVAALGWELAEYATFLRNTPEVATIYTDTLLDMTLGTLGAFLAGVIALAARGRASSSQTL